MDNITSIGEECIEKPRIGMKFDNLDEAWQFWNKYGKAIGFSVRKDYQNKRKIDKLVTNAVYVCYKQGQREEDKRRVGSIHRWEVRTNCKVKLNVVLENESGKYMIKNFIEEHNHELEPQETSHMLRSYRQINGAQAAMIDLARDSGITPKDTHELMTRDVGGRHVLGYVMEDQKTYLRSRREKNMAFGELGSIVKYLEDQKVKDASFFYSMQFDINELATNIFWADTKMILDYHDFGDVIMFDTTYGTNKELRPLGVFTGFNHHKQMVIFGGALMYDETADSFAWLFETFLKAHGAKEPRTIFTDQDAAMAKALGRVLPKTRHGLCTWHLMQNGIKHLSWRMKDGSPFLSDLKACMFDYVDENKFEIEWEKMLERYSLRGNDWLDRLYGLKEKWARCYMKYAFTLRIRSTQLSESLNSDLKAYLKCDLNLAEFFHHFDRVVEQKRSKELEAEFYARQKVPALELYGSPLLQQAYINYTPAIFKLFEVELRLALRVLIQKKDESIRPHEYIVCLHDSKEKGFIVLCDPTKDYITCSCKKFETMGILCCHTLKVFIILDVMDIPKRYILDRWTRGCRSAHIEERSIEGENINQWIRRIQSQLIRMTLQASTQEQTRKSMENLVAECKKQLSVCTIHDDRNVEGNVVNIDNQMEHGKGLKKRVGKRITKRPKPWYEKCIKKLKRPTSSEITRISVSNTKTNDAPESRICFQVSDHVQGHVMDLNLDLNLDPAECF